MNSKFGTFFALAGIAITAYLFFQTEEDPTEGTFSKSVVFQSITGLTGRITGQDLSPIAGANLELGYFVNKGKPVFITTAKGDTGEDGSFLIATGDGPGDSLRILKKGYPSHIVREIDLPGPGRVVNLGTLELPRGRSINIHTVDGAKGLPVTGAEISFARPSHYASIDGEELSTWSDPKGMKEIGPVATGEWLLTVRHFKYSTWQSTILVTPGPAELSVTVKLKKGPGIKGKAIDESGTPAKGVTIEAIPVKENKHDTRGPCTCKSGRNGLFHLQNLEEGKWSLRAKAKGFQSFPPATLSCPTGDSTVLQLLALPTIHGRVILKNGVDKDGPVYVALASPMAGNGLWTLSNSVKRVEIEENGWFTLNLEENVPQGPWVAVAWGKGLIPGQSKPFSLFPGTIKSGLQIELKPGGSVRGEVSPPLKAIVMVKGPKGLPFPPFLPLQQRIEAKAGINGSFSIGPLAPGPRRLTFSAPGRIRKIKEIVVESGKISDIGTVSLPTGVIASGLLLDPLGRPESGGLVSLIPPDGSEPIQVASGLDGIFRFPPLPPGMYQIKACKAGAKPMEMLMDYTSSSRMVELFGKALWIEEPIRINRSGLSSPGSKRGKAANNASEHK